MRIIAIALLLPLFAASSLAQDQAAPSPSQDQCVCTIFPFQPDPPCHEACWGVFVLEADLSQLQNTLKLSYETIREIERLRAIGVEPADLDQALLDEVTGQLLAVDEDEIRTFVQQNWQAHFRHELQ